MIEAIRGIGEYAIEEEGKSIDNPPSILVDSPANRYTKNILFTVLESGVRGFEYKGIKIEEYGGDKILKYLYKKGASHGPDLTPTSMITSIESTFEKVKILPWFKKHEGDKDDFLAKTGNCIREHRNAIMTDLMRNYSKENNVISLKINGKYVGDYKIFRDILVKEATKNFYFTPSFSGDNLISKSENQICSVCNQRQAEVYGFVNTFKFYTVDKPGFVSGGFQQRYAWKNYPVCLNCALILEAGKKYLGNNMNFNFYGFNYLVIPKFVNGVDEETRKEIFKKIERQRDPKFRNKEIYRITSDENEILNLMSTQKNYLNLNFMFYEAPRGYEGAVFNILLYIEDILPSRLNTLFHAKEEVDKIDLFRECMAPVFENKKITGEKPLEFNFGVLRTFFPYKKDPTTKKWVGYYKFFLDIVNKIFTNKTIDYYFLMHFIMQRIREDFINNLNTKISTLRGFMLLNYLCVLGIIKYKEEEKNMGSQSEGDWGMFEGEVLGERAEISERIGSFFREFDEFFDNEAKKAVFLEGVLTQLLLNIQYQERGVTPFRVKLKGLNLDEKQIKKLLPEIQNKLEEYGKNYYRTLESIISKYFISAGNGWEMSNDDINFYFVLGMNLSHIFKTKKEEKSEGGEGNE